MKEEKRRREEEMRSATEETAGHFFACVGCSPFAPDHVCCVTPERGPQCNRPYGMIKTGALYQYDDNQIRDGKIAIVAGGGNSVEILQEVSDLGVNTFVTGVTILNKHSQEAHDFAKTNRINILGGTHYSTEKFACIEMCKYFRKLGLSCKFIAGKPSLKDL